MLRSRNGETVMDYTLYISDDNSDGTPSVIVQSSSEDRTNSGLQSPTNQEKTPVHQQSTVTIDNQPQQLQPQQIQLSQQGPDAIQNDSDVNQRVLLLQHHQQIQQQIRLQNESKMVSVKPATGATKPSNSSSSFNAHLLQGRYLMMELIEGSTFHKCIDIKAKEHLVCKVSSMFD